MTDQISRECPVPDNVTDERSRAAFILHAALCWAVSFNRSPPGALECAAQAVYKRLTQASGINEERVRDFMAQMDQYMPASPQWPDEVTLGMRMDLLREELQEIEDALEVESFPEWVDGLLDLLYVTYGALASAGVHAAPVFREVHRANMAKLDGLVREDGKRLKPEGWKPPDIEGCLRDQGWRGR